MNGIVSLQEFPVDPNAVPVPRPTPSVADLDQITNALGGGANTMLMLNSSIDRGNDIAVQNQIIADRHSMSPLDFEAKYGSEIMRQMDMLVGADAERYLMENTDRGFGARVGDNINNVFTGLVGGVGDATTFVGGMVNRDVGRVFSGGTDWFRENMQDMQSTAQQRNRYINSIRAELDGQDNQLQYERDRKDGDSAFIAGLSYLGRGLVNGVSRFVEDPTSLETGVAEGIGSLFAGGAIGKGASLAGRLAGMGRATTTAMMPAAIGAMEGGSAYSGALQEVMGMTHEDLAANSPTYRELIAQGVDPARAKEAVATQAAEIAGMVQAPIGALTGRLVSRFEANPLGSKGFRDMVRNILNETVEEGIQSASGQFAQNLGVRQADENQMLIEGIGDQTAQGTILGSLTAGAIQTPNVPGAALRSAASALRTRAEDIQAQNEAGSGVTDEDIQSAAATVAENMGAVAEATDAMIEAIPEEIRDEIGTNSLRERIINAVSVTDADMERLGPEANAYLENTGQNVRENRINLLANTARMVVDPNSPMEAKLSGALFLLSEMNRQGKLYREDLEEAKNTLDQSSDEYGVITGYQSVMEQIASNPTMRSAMEWASKVSNVEAPVDVVRATTAKPSAISPETGRTVLKQADEGNISLTPAQRKAVQNSIDVVQIAQKAEALKEQAEREADPDYETDAVKDVNEQIMTRGREEDWGLSVDQHVARINTAVENGDPVALGAALRHFGNFAASQRNKALAAIQSIREGGEKEFARAGAYGKRNPVNGRITIHPNSSGSVAFGRRVIIEANALIEQANALMDTNPIEGLNRRLKTIPLPVEFFGEQARQQEAQETVQQGDSKKYEPDQKRDKTETKVPQKQRKLLLKVFSENQIAAWENMFPRLSELMPKIYEEVAVQYPTFNKGDAFINYFSSVSYEAFTNTILPRLIKNLEKSAQQRAPKNNKRVILMGNSKYTEKDQAKSDKANKFIGRGSQRSSTEQYRKNWGNAANTGVYTSDDVVFVSAEGNRNGRITPNFQEIQKALDAGAKIITDTETDRNRPYNIGEREVAQYLTDKGYIETAPGEWVKKVEDAAQIAQTPRELNEKERGVVIDFLQYLTDNFDFPQKFSEKIKFSIQDTYLENDPNKLSYAHNTNEGGEMQIFFSHQMAKDIEEGNRSKVVAHVLAHEFGHGVDFFYRDAASGMPYSAMRVFDADGVVRKEIAAQMEENAEFKKEMERYVLSHPEDDAFTRKEVFADMMGYYLTNPAKFAEVMPKTAKILDEVLDDAFGKNRAKAKFPVFSQEDGTATDATPGIVAIPAATRADPSVSLRSRIKFRFPFLYRAKEVGSRFYQAFRGDRSGPMLDRVQPLREFYEALGNSDSLREFVGSEPKFTVDTDQTMALQQYLLWGRDLMVNPENGVQKRLADFLKMPYNSKKPEGPTFGDLLLEGRDVVGTNQGRALGIVEQTSDGIRYNPALLQTATLAALHWFSGSQNRETYLDKEDVAKLTGLKVDYISNAKVEEFNSGVGLQQAVRGLAENITQFWGLNTDKNAPENLTKGIPEGIAKELLRAMEAQGFFTSGTIRVPGSDKTYTQFYFGYNITPELRSLLREMGPAKKLLEMAATREDNRFASTYDEKPKGIALTQMRNRAVRNTHTQRGIIRKAQAIAFNLYRNSYDMQRAIGKDAWIELMGSTVIKEDTPFNEEHLKSVKGRNLTISNAFDALEDQVAELEAYADKLGKSPEDVRKYYQFNYSRVNRLQMLGLVNPQSDKIARHVFLPTKTTVDLTDPNSKASLGFFMSLAQGLDIQKVQNFTPEQNAAAARAATVEEGGKYTELVSELAEWLRNGKQGSLAEWSGRLRSVDGGVSEHGIMSLLSAAEYVVARDTGNGGGLAEFTTHSYFEADGVTNGPANALMNLATMISPSWIETIRKGGAFIGHAAQTMVDQAGQADLYTTAANLLTQLQRDFASNLPDNIREVHDALFRVMQALGMKIDLKDNGDGTLSVTFDRKMLKNPLTITIYSSGINGIAGNVTSELLDNFYAAISEHLQSGRGSIFGDNMVVNGQPYGAAKLKADLKQVLGQSVYREEGEWVVTEATKPVQTGTNLANLTITPDGFSILKDNVRALLVDNMNTAIEQSVMGHVKEMVDTIQKATNAQSIILHYMFRKELMREMAARQMNPEKYPGYKRGDFLSQAELDGILKRLMPYGAVINTGNQSFFLGSGERGDLLDTQELTIDGQTIKVRMPKAFSRDLTDGYQTDAYAFSPSIAGVGGVPSFNIGTGDGRMIDVFLQKLTGYGVLPVFDGINLPVDRVFEGSLGANSAVMQTWTENPVQHVAESFAAFLRNDPLSSMFDPSDPFNIEMQALAEELTRNEQGTRRVKEVYGPDYIQAHFEHLREMLTSGAEQIGNRIEAMKQMTMSVDQMAGGNTSFQQQGSVKLPAAPNSTTVAQALTWTIEKVQKAKKKQDAVEVPSRNFMAAFRSKALTDEATGAMVADLAVLDAIRKTLNNKLPITQREMLAASLNALSDSDFRVVLGTPESVDRWEANNFPDAYKANVDSFYGKIDVENRVIYLTNPSAETLAHELLHAATITKMQGYYADNGSVTDTDGESIQRLEGLMNEWLVQSYDREGPAVAAAHRMAMSTIVGYLNQGKKAEAVNEFLAWSLTNQNIINIQKKMQVKNPLYMVLDKAISALKRLIWGHKKAPEIGTDMFSQVRFNARVLMATPTPVELFLRDLSQTVMYQSPSFGSDNRLSELRRVFGEHMVSYARKPVSTDPLVNKITYKERRQDALEALIRTDRIGQAMAIPFKLNMQQMSTFKWIGATLSMVDHLNTASLDRMQDIFDAVIDKISPDDFMYNTGDEGADRYQAQQKYNALTGINTTQYDKLGRSSQLTNFIGLVAVDPQFRDILRKMQMPQRLVPKGMSADALMDRATQGMAAGLAAYASGQGRNNENLLASMDALTQSLIENVGDQRSFIEQSVDNGLDKVDNVIKSYIEKGTAKFQKWASTVQNPVGKNVASWLSMLSKEFTAEGKASLNRTRISFMNQPQINTTLRSAVNEVIGRTEENAPIFDMITRTKTLVDQTRQRWVDEFPKEVRKWFKEPLTTKQWSDLYRAARTDMGVLFETHPRDQTLELLSSGSARQAEIARLEKLMGAGVIAKSKQLANFMVTGDAGIMLRPNAHAIHKLDAKGETETDIENLVTLYALEQSDKDVQTTLQNLIENDLDGFEKLYMALVSTRADEMQKVNSPVAMMNHTKGHIRGLNQEGVHLLIASRNDHAKLIGMGYTDMGDYVGSSADIGTEKKGYYFSPVSGRARFNQGIMHTVQWTQFGVDPQTGYTVGEIIAGRVSDPRAVAAITKRINRSNKTTENLRPIYGENGVVKAYERMADPMKLTNLNPSQDLAAALGAWRGRQTEEMSSQAVNEELVDKVYNQWLDGKRDRRTNEYERIDQSNDPIIRDAWAVVPKYTKDYIKTKFGDAGFRVRRDMVEDVIGARSATVGDFWTGNSRWSPEVQKQIRDIIVGFGGNDAYRYLVNAEKFYQEIITDSKVMIVIKSVVVPAINFISNVHQLSAMGVPVRHIFSGWKAKTVELNSYIKRREQERQLQNELFVAEGRGDSVAIRKLSTRIQSLQDSYKRMSIWPLLEAGEFGAITDGGLSQEDIAIAKGGYLGLIDKAVQKVPEGVRDVARYGLITRDTSLFKAMSRATQYGDFIAKAVLYDDLLRRKKLSQTEAMGKINEAFINYNRFAGRVRSYTESMGGTWFMHYKLRSMKVAQQMLHENPFRAIVHSAMMPRIPMMGTVGNPLSDNFLSVWLDGRLGYSLGPGMLFRAPSLNPWWNMTH